MPLFGRRPQKLFQFDRQEMSKIANVLAPLDISALSSPMSGHSPFAETEEEAEALEEAVGLMRAAWQNNPREALYALMASSYCMALPDYGQGIELLKDGLQRHPNDARLRYALATAYVQISSSRIR